MMHENLNRSNASANRTLTRRNDQGERKSTDDIQSSSKVGRSAIACFALVARMILEEVLLVLESLRDRSLVVDISLTTIDDGNVTQSQRNDSTSENVDDVSSLIPAFASHSTDQGIIRDRSYE